MNAKRFYKAHATGYPLHSRLKWRGLNISIENGVGSVREGVDGNGKPWRVRMKVPYGYIRNTESPDGDHLDVFVGPNLLSDKVFVVHTVDPVQGRYDEDKVFIGFDSPQGAKKCYLEHYTDPRWYGGMTQFDADHFVLLVKSGKLMKRKALVGKPVPNASKSELQRLLEIAIQANTLKQ